MVVVDSSALIPLAWVGRLDLVRAVFDDVVTVEDVESEVLVAGKPGTAPLDAFLDTATVRETPDRAEEVAELEGIATADAAVVLSAESRNDLLLANDEGLIAVARSHGVECFWVTTLLLAGTKAGILDAEEAQDTLYDLLDSGMNLHPQVYARVQDRLGDLGYS